jgi:putative glycerol-1-phosphate prenyltransferase
MSIFDTLEKIRLKRGAVCLALLDPDTKNDDIFLQNINTINKSDFDAILVGGSLIMDNEFNQRVKLVKSQTNLPVIIFPGSSKQISTHADAILYLSLISGRNPQYLIGEHIESAPVIYNIGLETIPTGYILLDGGKRSSVEIISNTTPLPMEKKDIILATALAGQYLGNKLIFLESGSGAENHAQISLIQHLSQIISIPIMVGGGIQNSTSAKAVKDAGAGYVVVGTMIENGASSQELINLTKVVHSQ